MMSDSHCYDQQTSLAALMMSSSVAAGVLLQSSQRSVRRLRSRKQRALRQPVVGAYAFAVRACLACPAICANPRGILHRDVGEHLAVDFEAERFQAVHEFAVGNAIQAGGRADALDPQPAELALAYATVAIREAVRAIRGLLHGLVQLALGEEKTLGAPRKLLASRAALGAAFNSGHDFFSCGRARSCAGRVAQPLLPMRRQQIARAHGIGKRTTSNSTAVERLHGVLRFAPATPLRASGARWPAR